MLEPNIIWNTGSYYEDHFSKLSSGWARTSVRKQPEKLKTLLVKALVYWKWAPSFKKFSETLS